MSPLEHDFIKILNTPTALLGMIFSGKPLREISWIPVKITGCIRCLFEPPFADGRQDVPLGTPLSNAIILKYFDFEEFVSEVTRLKMGASYTFDWLENNIPLTDVICTPKSGQKKLPFAEAVDMITKAFAEAGQEFADIFTTYLKEGRIDAFPRVGKRTGAFCSPNIGAPTMVMTNYGGKLDDVSTIAHEMGHAFHSDFAKTQPAIYEGYTISVAEVASTFFEHILSDSLMEKATAEEK